MIDKNNKYTNMQRHYYNTTHHIMAIENHKGHNSNPDYYGLLLKDIANSNKWEGKKALDFGCGCGRNIFNMISTSNFERVDGCDISAGNIEESKKYLESKNIPIEKYKLYITTGTTLEPLEDEQYDFIMSTIVLQHISVHSIRLNILKDIFRVMKSNSIFSFQMVNIGGRAGYFDDVWDAPGTNGAYDVNVSNPDDLINELKSIGFKDISYVIRPEWDAGKEQYFNNGSTWIYVNCNK